MVARGFTLAVPRFRTGARHRYRSRILTACYKDWMDSIPCKTTILPGKMIRGDIILQHQSQTRTPVFGGRVAKIVTACTSLSMVRLRHMSLTFTVGETTMSSYTLLA